MHFIEGFFANLFGSSPAIATVAIAMFPVVELRGAIPFGASEKLFGSSALSVWQSFGVSVLSCIFVAAVLLLLLQPVFALLKKVKGIRRVIHVLEEKFERKARKASNDKISDVYCNFDASVDPSTSVGMTRKKQLLFVLVFAAVPLPLTGVWTAAAVAVFLGLPYLRALVAISIGTLISGLLIVCITVLCGQYATYIFHAFLGLAFVIVVGIIVVAAFKKRPLA